MEVNTIGPLPWQLFGGYMPCEAFIHLEFLAILWLFTLPYVIAKS